MIVPILQQTPSRIEVIGALGPVVVGFLTVIVYIFLVILYRKQQKQLEAQHEAILVIEQADWNGNELTVELANYGNGAAEDVHLVTLVHVDDGAHREYSIYLDLFERPGSQSWTTTLPADNQAVRLEAESKVKMPVYGSHPFDWAQISFSNFLQKMKRRGATEVKFIHLIRAKDLAGNLVYRDVYPEMRITNPQQFSRGDTVESLSNVTHTGKDGTFRNFYDTSQRSKLFRIIRYKFNKYLNLVPFVRITNRPLDASGTRLVKRIFLRYKTRTARSNARDRISNLVNMGVNSNSIENFGNIIKENISEIRNNIPSKAVYTVFTIILLMVVFATQQILATNYNLSGPKSVLENADGPIKYLVWLLLPIAHSSANHLYQNLLILVPLSYILEQRTSLSEFSGFIYVSGLFANVFFPWLLIITGENVALAIGASSITHALVARESVYRVYKLAVKDDTAFGDWGIFVLSGFLFSLYILNIIKGVTPSGASVTAHMGGLIFGFTLGAAEAYRS